ncbi:MAG: TerB family tellurite resistance protein [Thalassolituus sp.]|jgi:uncharacterized tellurite resistance protein B-like protein|uniref:Co-chaperone DjlA N-terminal domain-containing protein n=2 Tax=root TaxID=1 RepID=M5DS14_9GAMM|nr:TerB family tellurite resistance protein [Thalassolituus oleivorans]PCI47538.1 MAG: TerB family tellurite resistance protein [Oceanospirillales bacterium]PHQ84589.1 MAG: TerB family tellurite resistance protein [Thalassobium sp.]AHK15818.1 hypothetical protein R615_08585 [Thalassolituus oleivorans R6-15]MCA6128634.1 hypothetical protein [Thalassolituus oleivorans 4BN06-13]CCU72226.1 hypothetical protein TOL_1806 [Thalassolituus oleivorans MIL-1]
MIKALFSKLLAPTEPVQEVDVQLASAVLLVEIMSADHSIDAAEQTALIMVLSKLFAISKSDAETLMAEASAKAKDSVDLFRFTEAVHKRFSEAQKFQLIVGLWAVAYASNGLDKYEEHMIRRISDLLYIPHGEFIRAKLIAREQA